MFDVHEIAVVLAPGLFAAIFGAILLAVLAAIVSSIVDKIRGAVIWFEDTKHLIKACNNNLLAISADIRGQNGRISTLSAEVKEQNEVTKLIINHTNAEVRKPGKTVKK